MRFALVIGAAALLASCHQSSAVWSARLADSAVVRLGGAWAITLDVDSTFGTTADQRPVTTGSIALVLNREQIRPSIWTAIPVAFGTYDIKLEAINVSTGEAETTPDVWVQRDRDSLVIILSPRANWPVTVVGVWFADSLVGRWHEDTRAGPTARGRFVMRRR